MELETSKNLGGIGAIILVIGELAIFANAYAGLLSLIGIILVLIGLKGFADNYKEAGIFNNALYGFITTIVGGVVVVGIVVATVLNAIVQLGVTDINEWITMIQSAAQSGDFTGIMDLVGPIIIGFAVAVIILYIAIIVSAILYRKSFNKLGEKSGVGMFGTSGILLLIGAVLTIVLFGFLLMWIAYILLAVAFFSFKPQATQQASAPPAPPL